MYAEKNWYTIRNGHMCISIKSTFVPELLKTFLNNPDIFWKYVGSKLQSAEIKNLKLDVLSTYEVNASITNPSKYLEFSLNAIEKGKKHHGEVLT